LVRLLRHLTVTSPVAAAPDGTLFAYGNGIALYLAGLAGGPPTRIAASPTRAVIRRIRWTPDGSRLLFTDAGGEMYVVHTDGTGVARVGFPGVGDAPDWQPTP
jgi:Tol biopolymer transport system component